MAIDLTTIGVKISWAVETAAGTRPTTGYKKFTGIKSTPDYNSAPETIETTTFDNLEYRSYTQGLKDQSDAKEYTANFSNEFVAEWNKFVQAAETAKESGLKAWICQDVPGADNAFYIPVEPATLSQPSMEVAGVYEGSAYVTVSGEPVWGTAPTYAEE